MSGQAELRIGVAGLGTVGGGLLQLLTTNGALMTARAGRAIRVSAVSARRRKHKRAVSLKDMAWADDPVELAQRDDVDLVVELIGGADGDALRLIEAALTAGKPVVTANKALLAHHGQRLAALAAQSGAPLAYEAAVAGGIPVIKAIREGLAGNRLHRIYGILNGTCNFILSEMRSTGRGFEEVLQEAQQRGYAEADPSFDIEGVDAAHKLTLLTSLAFGTLPDFQGLKVEGITNISAVDVAYAEEFGYRIKLLGVAEAIDGKISQRVRPCLVKADTPIAKVEGVDNAVVAEGDQVGGIMLQGPGAGSAATASAVAADIADIAAGRFAPVFGVPLTALTPAAPVRPDDHRGRYYVRLNVIDRPGVIADIAGVLRDESISIESLLQRADPDEQGTAPVVVITHKTREDAISAALESLNRLESNLGQAHLLAIENF